VGEGRGEGAFAMPSQLTAKSAALATGHPLGATAGLDLLNQNGNAIDAAVAAMIALCVVVPGSVGIAGYGGSAVIYSAKRRKVFAIDFDSRAPIAFQEGLVTADKDSNYYGARAVTVPAVVAGLAAMLDEHGTKSWRDVSQPAIRLANEGFEFDAEHERHLRRCAPKFDPQSLAALFPDENQPRVGYHWKQPDLARLLTQLADDGPQTFYDGDIPRRICQYLREQGGILSEEDFRTYQPQTVDALHSTCRGHDLYTPPPPSGGITSLSIVQTMERLLESRQVEPWSADYFHLLAEATKLCWQERHTHLGDPDFVDSAIDQMLSQESAITRAQRINQQTHPGSLLPAPRSTHTANVIATDAEGNLVSVTATQGWMYGSHLVVDGMGLVLNHGMSRFDYAPGHPNAPAARKRMQHNMSPLIALRSPSPSRPPSSQDGLSPSPSRTPPQVLPSPSPLRGGVRGGAEPIPAFACGLPGGPKIVTVTAQLVLNSLVFGASPKVAVDTPRLHTDGTEPLLVSEHMPPDVISQLDSLGHTIRRERDMGGPTSALAIDPKSKTIHVAAAEATGAVAGM
jgi:gamma-glutamyltranspeptidase / glutathione hydrolase